MPGRKTELTKPANRRKSIVRQTRAQTAAAAAEEDARANLQISGISDDAATSEFEPSFVDTTGGSNNDCAGCKRPNNAELYMVQCDKCEAYYHFTCGKVDVATVKEKPFVCEKYLPPHTSTHSITSRTTTSSVRATRAARELARMEEEQRLSEEADKVRLDAIARKKAFLAKKSDLLDQQEEIEEKSSRKSIRSSRASSERVKQWVDEQKETSKPGPSVDDTPPVVTEPISPVATDEVDRQVEDLSRNSTPIPGSQIVELNSEPVASTSATNTDVVEVVTQNRPPPIPFVNIKPIVSFEFKPLFPNLGFVPKTIRPTQNYEQWLSKVDRPTVESLQAQHEKEIQGFSEREKAFVDRLQIMEQQHAEQMSMLRQREASLEAELKQRDQQRKEIIEVAKQATSDRDGEIERLRQNERILKEQLKALSVAKKKEEESGAANGGQQNSQAWFGGELAKLQQSRVENAKPTIHGSTHPGNKPVRVERNEVRKNSTPLGTRSLPLPHVGSSVESTQGIRPVVPPLAPLLGPPQVSSPFVADGSARPRSALTPEQIAARHVVSKELPPFHGDSTEWPAFISAYTYSTEACGYSDSENLLRLSRALKEPAKSTVSSLLYHPSSVPQVLYSLQLRYGRPQQIVEGLLKKVKDIPSPTDMDSLTSFGLMVQNFCGHLKILGMDKHLANPELLKQLVKKLPPHVLYNWALYQQTLPDVDLNVFGEFMAGVAVATSSVAFPEDKPSKVTKSERPKSKEKAFVNTHSAGERSDEDEVSEKSDSIESCPLCATAGHQLGACIKFKKFSLDERWQTVKKLKLCRRCLISHSRYTCKGELCDVNGCQGWHHRLLHNDRPKEGTAKETATESSTTSTNATVTIHRQPASTTLFRILPVTLYGKNGQVNTFAFLDDGSSVTLVERKIAATLGLEGRTESLCIHWTGGVKKRFADSQRVAMDISGVASQKRFKLANVYTVDELGLPTQTVDYEMLAAQYSHLQKLPIQSFKSAVPGILIGLNNIHLLATLKLRQGTDSEPIASKTRIGWAVSGSSPDMQLSMLQGYVQVHDRKEDEVVRRHQTRRGRTVGIGGRRRSTEPMEERSCGQDVSRPGWASTPSRRADSRWRSNEEVSREGSCVGGRGEGDAHTGVRRHVGECCDQITTRYKERYGYMGAMLARDRKDR